MCNKLESGRALFAKIRMDDYYENGNAETIQNQYIKRKTQHELRAIFL